jgi:membrane-bound serine protease (ClpP class)
MKKKNYKSSVLPGLFVWLLIAFPVIGTETGSAVYVVPIHGNIEPAMTALIRRHVTTALDKGAGVIIFDIDTFGGRVDSALQISSFIGSIAKAKTFAYVRSGPEGMGVSWSAGALIAMSCSAVYMAPGTSIGAAAPVLMGADGQTQPAGEKTVSALRAQMAALAEKNGHPVALALAMVDQDVELYEMEEGGKVRAVTLAEAERLEKEKPKRVVRGKIISAKGKLLSLTAGEAERYGLSAGTVSDFPALMEKLGVPGEPVILKESLADKIVGLITSSPVQGILILIGLVALFLEISTPGFGIPGTIAVICFLTIFGGNSLLGTVGSLELILFLIGVGLLAVEIFILPGFGIAGISGIALIGMSLVFSMQDFIIPGISWEWDILYRNLITVISGLFAGLMGIGILALAAPKLHFFDGLTLKTVIRGTSGGRIPEEGESDDDRSQDTERPDEDIPRGLPGTKGTAVSVLRPSGRAEIGGRVYSVETEGRFVEEGTPVEVVRVRGNRIVVRPASRQD